MGIIAFYEAKYDEAVEWFQNALKLDPTNSDILFNYSKALFEKGEYFESWRYLTRIENKTWEVYDLLGDTQLNLNNPAMALHYYKKAYDKSSLEELKVKYITYKIIFQQKHKIAIFCLPQMLTFSKNIAEVLSHTFEVRLVSTTNLNDIISSCFWTDIVWFEYFNEVVAETINRLPKSNKKVVLRVHDSVSLEQFARIINWENVDNIVFSCEHTREIFKINYREIFEKISDKSCVIYNGIDLNALTFKKRGNGFRLAVISTFYNEDKSIHWLQVARFLSKTDKRYTLHIAEIFHPTGFKDYYKHFLENTGLRDNVKFYESPTSTYEFLNEFLEDKNYILCTNSQEIFYIIVAMAKGVKPIVHNLPGIREFCPNERIYNFIDELPELVSESYDSESYRKQIEEKYSLENQVKEMTKIIEKLGEHKNRNNVLTQKEYSEDKQHENLYNMDYTKLKTPSELISDLQKLAEVKKDEIGFFSTGRIGDNIYLFLLSEAIKESYKPSKLKIIVPHKLLRIAELWDIDVIIPVEEKILEKICFSTEGYLYGLNRTSLGKLNSAHPGKLAKLSGIDDLDFLKLVKYQLGVGKNAQICPPRDIPVEIYNSVKSNYPEEILGQSIIVSLESKAVTVSDKEKELLLKEIVSFAVETKTKILFNEEKWYKVANLTFPNNSDMFFKIYSSDLIHFLALTKIVGKSFAIRSGLADLMAISRAKVIVYYPKSLYKGHGIMVPCIEHFSMKELTLINPNIVEIEGESNISSLKQTLLSFLNIQREQV